ncbi:MAG TPA: head-tail connector protein [Symbiobacteriaceae bacterium]|nr:head-tail connector protein [Symbiobacteriaceae bacterium]
MLDEVRSALRVDGTDLDTEIQGLIDAAVSDLILSGVSAAKAQAMVDPLIKRAVIIYCQAHFDYADRSAERLLQSYAMLKAHLSMAVDYREVTTS